MARPSFRQIPEGPGWESPSRAGLIPMRYPTSLRIQCGNLTYLMRGHLLSLWTRSDNTAGLCGPPAAPPSIPRLRDREGPELPDLIGGRSGEVAQG